MSMALLQIPEGWELAYRDVFGEIFKLKFDLDLENDKGTSRTCTSATAAMGGR